MPLRSSLIHLAYQKPNLRPYLLPLLKTAETDPFDELDAKGKDAFRGFTVYLSSWMGFSRGVNIKEAAKVWRSSAPLRKWLTRHANNNTGTLYYGAKVDRQEDLPAIGSTYASKLSILHWSKKRRVSEWFAGLPSAVIDKPSWAGGFLVEAATVPPKEVIADLSNLSRLCRAHPDSFKALQPRTDAVEMFLSTTPDGEMEVLTTNRVTGKVVEAMMYR